MNISNEREDCQMMIEKFIKDYAHVKVSEINIDTFLLKEEKEKAISKINKALLFRERGLLTRDETISIIVNCFEQ